MTQFLQSSRIVSLSHPVHPAIPRWPGDPIPEFELVATLERDGFFLRRFSLGEHSGTHINTPAGFYADGAGIDEFSPSDLVLPAIVIDVRERAAANPDYLLGVDALLEWEREHGPIPPRCLALLYTGWQEKWPDPQSYLGISPRRDSASIGDAGAGDMHFPGFGAMALGVLLTQRGAAGIGIDTHGVDGGLDTEFSINRRTLERKRIVLENLCNLDQLPPTGATVVIGALQLVGGSGSPASVFAFLP